MQIQGITILRGKGNVQGASFSLHGQIAVKPTAEQSVHCAASEALGVAELRCLVLPYKLQLLHFFSLFCFQIIFFPCPLLALILKSDHFPFT